MYIGGIKETTYNLLHKKYSSVYDYSLSLCRIIAMFMIVFNHIGDYYHIRAVSLVCNSGVPMFFIISGILYSNKEISDKKKWFANRILRLWCPLFAWTIYYIVDLLVSTGGALSSIDCIKILMLITNMQGLQHLFMNCISVNGPWFFTIIMFCYILLIPWKCIEKKNPKINSWLAIFLFCILTSAMRWINIDLSGFMYFFFGYIISKIKKSNTTNKIYSNDSLLKPIILFLVGGGIN